MTRALAIGVVCGLALAACFRSWDVSGPWACDAEGRCAEGLTCDDGVCCRPGGAPACPTLPVEGSCANGRAPSTFFRDLDGDGVGDESTGRAFCSSPVKERWVRDAGDCNDRDVFIGPYATEACNAVDDDCDGVIDDGTRTQRWYADSDDDGFGVDCDAGCVLQACIQPKGYAARGGDCAPSDATRFPGALERCDNVDDNCNGQPDDGPFDEVEPKVDGGEVGCSVAGAKGVCVAGGMQCVFDPMTTRFQATCVPRKTPEPDLCDDGVDQDCSGVADDQPGCGGPAGFISAEGVEVKALTIVPTGFPATGSRLPPRCLAGEAGAERMSWLNPTWIASGADRQLWSLEAPPGMPWDLSRAQTRLFLDLAVRALINPASPDAWGDGGYFPSPVITLCGAQAGELVRYYPTGTQVLDGTRFTKDLSLWNANAGWVVENGAVSLSRRAVRRIEIIVSPMPPASGTVTFAIDFSRDAGFH